MNKKIKRLVNIYVKTFIMSLITAVGLVINPFLGCAIAGGTITWIIMAKID